MNDYNIELKNYISKILRDILLVNDIDFEISECNDLTHFEISCNDEQHQIVKEFLEQYNYILDNSQLYDNDLRDILIDYDFDDIYKIVSNNDFYIYDLANMSALGEEIYELYYGELANGLYRYFDFDAFGKDYLLEQEYVELENDRVIIFYF